MHHVFKLHVRMHTIPLANNGYTSMYVYVQVYEDKDVVGTAVDILMSIADFHCSILRDHILQDAENQSEVSNL